MGAEEGDVPSQIPRGLMTRIVRARVEEILEYSRDQLAKSGHSQLVGKRIVLTGGTSQMQGLQRWRAAFLADLCVLVVRLGLRVCPLQQRAQRSPPRRAL